MFMAPCVLLLVILPLMSTKLINNEYLQKFIVRFHNKIRGQERAADMMKLSWSFQLAKEADQWAHKCVFEHAMIARGQNLGLIGDPGSIKYNIQHIMQLWVDEKKKYDPRKKGCNNSCHYTQLVWAKTTHVGCSIHFCNNFGTSKRFTNYMFFVCFYSPRI
ncbi:peptidase inhibitor 15-like [Octopus bimaculoides]|uniref:peptidase inhibitor 15-like n=1 Tax=Octopus bimaculoides TaxID=37653 RepID=UPI0022E3AA78|nr:peptidase inhibitor 15-like [Octopus bimaculoides]